MRLRSLLVLCVMAACSSLAAAGVDYHLDLSRPTLRGLKEVVQQSRSGEASWLLVRERDGATFSIDVGRLGSVQEAKAAADPRRVSQGPVHTHPLPRSPVTGRQIGETYQVADDGPGVYHVFVRDGADVYEAWVSSIGKDRKGFAVRHTITVGDKETLEDLVLAAIRVWRPIKP